MIDQAFKTFIFNIFHFIASGFFLFIFSPRYSCVNISFYNNLVFFFSKQEFQLFLPFSVPFSVLVSDEICYWKIFIFDWEAIFFSCDRKVIKDFVSENG